MYIQIVGFSALYLLLHRVADLVVFTYTYNIFDTRKRNRYVAEFIQTLVMSIIAIPTCACRILLPSIVSDQMFISFCNLMTSMYLMELCITKLSTTLIFHHLTCILGYGFVIYDPNVFWYSALFTLSDTVWPISMLLYLLYSHGYEHSVTYMLTRFLRIPIWTMTRIGISIISIMKIIVDGLPSENMLLNGILLIVWGAIGIYNLRVLYQDIVYSICQK